MKRLHIFLVTCVLLTVVNSCTRVWTLDNPYEGKEVYTRVNMRYDRVRKKGSYIAYKVLELLPANNKVTILKIWRNRFLMKISSELIVNVDYKELWGEKPINEILPLLFSEKDISAELSKFNDIEKRGIKIGKALVGMRKKAVIVALGYPAAHKTPSLDQDVWLYWQSRFSSYLVEFENNKVLTVEEAQ